MERKHSVPDHIPVYTIEMHRESMRTYPERFRKFWENTIRGIQLWAMRESIFQEYAEAIGIESLTKEQKQQALLEHVLGDG